MDADAPVRRRRRRHGAAAAPERPGQRRPPRLPDGAAPRSGPRRAARPRRRCGRLRERPRRAGSPVPYPGERPEVPLDRRRCPRPGRRGGAAWTPLAPARPAQRHVLPVADLRGRGHGPRPGGAWLHPDGPAVDGRDDLRRRHLHRRARRSRLVDLGDPLRQRELRRGHFLLGHRQLGFALVYDETGRVTGTTQVDGRVILDGDGPWPERIELTAAGDEWEFLPAATGRMVDLMPIPNPQIEGRWRRVGDTREPAHWFAWGEVAPGHGTTPIRD